MDIKIDELRITGIVVKGLRIKIRGKHVTKVVLGVLGFALIFGGFTGCETGDVQSLSSMLSGILEGG